MTRTPALRRRAGPSAGLTLVEVLAAMLVLGLMVTSSSWVMSQAVMARAEQLDDPLTAAMLAGEIHELALGLSTEPTDGAAATVGYEVVALDRLNGALFSPPIDSNGFDMPTRGDWSQSVVLKLHDLGGRRDEAYSRTDPYGNRVVKLEVTIAHHSQPQGVFTWWLNP